MHKIDKRNFYTGTVFLMLGVLSFSFMPMVLRRFDYIFMFDASQFKDLGVFLCIIGLIFWLNCEGHFKRQIAMILLLCLFFIFAVGLNFVISYP